MRVAFVSSYDKIESSGLRILSACPQAAQQQAPVCAASLALAVTAMEDKVCSAVLF